MASLTHMGGSTTAIAGSEGLNRPGLLLPGIFLPLFLEEKRNKLVILFRFKEVGCHASERSKTTFFQ